MPSGAVHATTSRSVYAHAGNRIHPLTSFRFFAAMYVVVYHTLGSVYPTGSGLWGKFIGNGFVAVSFFFTLSGYILATVYCRYDHAIGRNRFWTARFARIYPLFLVTLILDTPTLLLSRMAKYGTVAAVEKTSVTFVGNMAMLQAWMQKLSGINNPGWSLSVETFFYLLFPFIAVRLWRLRMRSVLVLLPVLYASGMGLVLFAIHAHFSEYVIKYTPIFHLHEFCIGILLAKLHAHLVQNQSAEARLRQLSPWMLAGGMAAYFGVTQFTSDSTILLINDGLLTPLFSIMIVALASGHKMVTRAFSAPWLVVLGEASYGLYLIHVPLAHYLGKMGLGHSRVAYPFYICTAVGVSIVSYYWLGRPSRSAITTAFKSVSSGQTVTVPSAPLLPATIDSLDSAD